ncbi:MAG: sulfotransferase [Planctomycetota bacterium]|jgi:tetratricopeptide (TPR) repeat protein
MPPARPAPQVSRNDPCPCGSGKKYKKCCMAKATSARAAAPALRPPKQPPGRMLETAEEHRRAGRLDEAQDLYRQVIEARPRTAPALFGLGRIRGRLGDLDEAIGLTRQAIAADGKRADYHLSLSDLLMQDGQIAKAQQSAARAAALDPANAAAHCMVGVCHQRMHRLDEARAALDKALSLDPDHASAEILLATVQRQQGGLTEARDRLEELGRRALPPEVRQQALKEHGFVLDKLGEYDAAFKSFEAGGHESASTAVARRADRDFWYRHIDHCKSGITRELLRKWTRDDFPDPHPVPSFLVGFPRSGTTLTEQVLAAHPAIVTTDEKQLILATKQEMAGMLGGQDELPTMLDRLDRDDIVRLRALYWEKAASIVQTKLADKVFVDKLPLNIVDVGMINVLFPEARLIVALRDPRDVCLSCFMQLLGLNEATVNFLSWERTAEFYARVMDLWLHQREIITLPFVEIRYEDTVSDLESQARRLLGLLDLEWDESVTQFHAKARKRYISTPSYAAVREPVHRRAMGRWHNYQAPIERVSAVLEPFVKAFGYGAGESGS